VPEHLPLDSSILHSTIRTPQLKFVSSATLRPMFRGCWPKAVEQPSSWS